MSLTVVLIDDDPDELDFMKEAIGSIDRSIHFMTFLYPEEAMRMLSGELVLLPDFIFIDINMPRKPGAECLTELRSIKEFADVPIIMYSTTMLPSITEGLKKAGATYTVQKPIRSSEYHEFLTSIFQKK